MRLRRLCFAILALRFFLIDPIGLPYKYGAGEGIRTLDINLGKVALYQLSYARIAVERKAKRIVRALASRFSFRVPRRKAGALP